MAHNYMECSNKGICDRTTGDCECFDGYDGAACQRASCANDCSGHGTCQSIAQIADNYFGNVYAFWDKKATRGCVCDAGYDAPDCSQRKCKYGTDPLYVDDATARTTKVAIALSTFAANSKIAIKFYDVFGEDYTTQFFNPLGADAAASCLLFVNALKALPNNAVPSVNCYSANFVAATSITVTLDFVSNPGYLKMPELVTANSNGVSTISTTVASISTVDIGEFTDYWATSCSLSVSPKMMVAGTPAVGANQVISADGTAALSADDLKALKKCLGDADGNAANNVEITNWDIPLPATFIHVAKASQTVASASSFIRTENLLITSATMEVINTMTDITQTLKLYVTDGTAKKVGAGAITVAANANSFNAVTDVTCETSGSTPAASNCIQVGSRIWLVNNAVNTEKNQGLLYTVVKVVKNSETPFVTVTLDYKVTSQVAAEAAETMFIYQFIPASTGNYEYVSQCSNRGACDSDTGLCTCFKGYTKDDCSQQSSLAM